MDAAGLARLDESGYVVLDAITYAKAPPAPSHASPHAFVAIDGKTYWVKRTAQQGLLAELVAGRLGHEVGAAPLARIVHTSAAAAPQDGCANHLLGLGVGVLDQLGMENLRHLAHLMPGGLLDPAKIDIASRLLVLAFQTWIGVGDTQILVDMRTGQLMSIDHGECFADTSQQLDPVVIATPGLADAAGSSATQALDAALTKVTSVTDRTILEVVARVPSGPEWRSEPHRRLELGHWLGYRRDRLPEVMRRWASQ